MKPCVKCHTNRAWPNVKVARGYCLTCAPIGAWFAIFRHTRKELLCVANSPTRWQNRTKSFRMIRCHYVRRRGQFWRIDDGPWLPLDVAAIEVLSPQKVAP